MSLVGSQLILENSPREFEVWRIFVVADEVRPYQLGNSIPKATQFLNPLGVRKNSFRNLIEHKFLQSHWTKIHIHHSLSRQPFLAVRFLSGFSLIVSSRKKPWNLGSSWLTTEITLRSWGPDKLTNRMSEKPIPGIHKGRCWYTHPEKKRQLGALDNKKSGDLFNRKNWLKVWVCGLPSRRNRWTYHSISHLPGNQQAHILSTSLSGLPHDFSEIQPKLWTLSIQHIMKVEKNCPTKGRNMLVAASWNQVF